MQPEEPEPIESVESEFEKEATATPLQRPLYPPSPSPREAPPPPRLQKLSLDLIKVFPPDLPVSHAGSFSWTIRDWSSLKATAWNDRIISPSFKVPVYPGSSSLQSNHEWRVLLFPNGNKAGSNDCMAIFLECVELGPDGSPVDRSTLPLLNLARTPEKLKWHVCAYFHIALVNEKNEEIYVAINGAHHRFNSKETDWGFAQFCNHSSLTKIIDGYDKCALEGDTFKLRVFVKEIADSAGVLWHSFVDWDSKLETGYVGIKNQGATCYLNSLIQSLYYTNYFRKATYEIPTQNDDPTKSVAYALQRLFYHMQFSPDAVGTNELTKSFGWDTMDAFHQHDVQELNRVLQDNLENTMKGTPAEGAIRKLFTGKMKSYIKCVGVEYESSRVEDYYDIQLNVKGCKNLHESFVDYCKVEMLDGENKYFAEGYGQQDAKKGIIFETFPPVLHLQLKRFDYDMERDQFVKINDRHEFPMEIDVSEFLSPDADRSVAQKYLLQGVLVHSGDLNAGHYYALLRPQKGGPWFKYDDDRVVPATERDVLEANFGGEATTVQGRAGMRGRFYTNAYMLVYIRQGDEDEILAEVTEEQIPVHLRNRVQRDIEEAEAKRVEEQERHLFLQVHVVNDNDLAFHSGFDIGFPLDARATSASTPVRVFKARRDQSLGEFLQVYASEINVDAAQVRFWNIVSRQNKTLRIESAFPEEKLKSRLADVVVYQKTLGELRIYAQLASSDISKNAFAGSPRIGNLMSPQSVSKEIILFIKQYDPLTQTLKVALSVCVKDADLISSILPAIRISASISPDQPILLFEEVKPGMIESLALENTFGGLELGDGDILCFQVPLSASDMDILPDPVLATAPGYYEMLQNRIEVFFKHRGVKDDSIKEIRLVLNKKMSYEQVVSHLSNEIHHEASKIKLYASKTNGLVGAAIPQRQTLHEMTQMQIYGAMNNRPLLLFYELLDISLEELDRKRYVKISFLENGIKEHGPHTLLVDRSGTIQGLAQALLEKVKVSVDHYRVVEVSNSRRVKIHNPQDSLLMINDYAGSLFVESFGGEEELELEQGLREGRMVEVFHFSKDVYRAHSIPFTFLLIPGEIFSATKDRLAARMNIPQKEFDKIKVALIAGHNGKPVYPQDDDSVENELPELLAIGLDHIDKGRKSGGVGLKIN